MHWLIKHVFCALIWRSPKRIMFRYFLKLVTKIFLSPSLIFCVAQLRVCNCNFSAAREDKLNDDNRSTVNSFQSDLTQQLGTLSSSLAASVSRQREHLQIVENLCNSFLQIHDKVFTCHFNWSIFISIFFPSFFVVNPNKCSWPLVLLVWS